MIKQEILFTESQRFKQWWLWLLILGLDCTFLFMLYQQMVMKVQIGNHPASNTVMLASAGLVLLLTLLFANTKLITRIEKDGIYVKFYPFHRKYKYYRWEKIVNSYIRTYSPLSEYGGWGIRYSMGGKGMAYNVSGNQGLQLELEDGKKVLIGTANPTELEAVLNKVQKNNPY